MTTAPPPICRAARVPRLLVLDGVRGGPVSSSRKRVQVRAQQEDHGRSPCR